MRKTVPDWLRTWALAVLIGMTLGAGGIGVAAVKWYGDTREEQMLNADARKRMERIEQSDRKQSETIGNLDGSIKVLAESINNLNITLREFNTTNRREHDLQWQAINKLAPRR